MAPRGAKTENDKARREVPARLVLLVLGVSCFALLAFQAVEYGLSFRREEASLRASAVETRAFLLDESDERIDINRATAADLQAVPGIGPEIARRVLELRQERGGFSFLEELTDVPGIGEKRFEALKEYFFCPQPEIDPAELGSVGGEEEGNR